MSTWIENDEVWGCRERDAIYTDCPQSEIWAMPWMMFRKTSSGWLREEHSRMKKEKMQKLWVHFVFMNDHWGQGGWNKVYWVEKVERTSQKKTGHGHLGPYFNVSVCQSFCFLLTPLTFIGYKATRYLSKLQFNNSTLLLNSFLGHTFVYRSLSITFRTGHGLPSDLFPDTYLVMQCLAF